MGNLILNCYTCTSTTFIAVIELYLIIAFAQCATYDNDEFRRFQIECIDESKADPNDILKIKSGDWFKYPSIPVQKWALCVLVRSGLMSQQGVFKLDEALINVPEKEHNEIMKNVDECLYQEKRLPFEIAWNYVKCFNRKNPTEFKLL